MYRTLPHFEASVMKQAQIDRHLLPLQQELHRIGLKHKQLTRSGQTVSADELAKKKLMTDLVSVLRCRNQPIPINDVHEFSFLFLQEYYKRRPTCDIFNLDPSAVLNILSKVDCFPDNVKDQATKVRDDIRNPWAHAVMEEWTDIKMGEDRENGNNYEKQW